MNLGSFTGGRGNPLIITLPTSYSSANYYIKTSIWNKNNSYGVDYDFQVEHLERNKAYLYGQEFNDGTSFVREYADFFAIGQWNSSGSNTGEIIENEYGYYIELSNGQKIAWGYLQDSVTSKNTAVNSRVSKKLYFPVQFKQLLVVTPNPIPYTNTRSNGGAEYSNDGITIWAESYMSFHGGSTSGGTTRYSSTTTTVNCGYIAIGY